MFKLEHFLKYFIQVNNTSCAGYAYCIFRFDKTASQNFAYELFLSNHYGSIIKPRYQEK